jgi:hypothetical protein
MVGNALCEITHQAGNRSAMMSASIPFVGGEIMLTQQKVYKIVDLALLSLLVLEAVFVTVGIAIPPASAQAAYAQAQIDSFVFAPKRLTPDASGKTFRSAAQRGPKGWIALHRPDGDVVYIKLDQIVFVMCAKNTGADQRAHSKILLLNGHSDVRESVEEVMQAIENDSLLAKDGT